MELDVNFLRKEGRPWKPVIQNATSHTSPDLEGLSKRELAEKLGENAWGHTHHHVDLQTAGGAILVQRDDCVRIQRPCNEGEDSADIPVCVEAVLSVVQTREEASRGDSGTAAEVLGSPVNRVGLAAAERVFWLKGWRLLRARRDNTERSRKATWFARTRGCSLACRGTFPGDSYLWPVEGRLCSRQSPSALGTAGAEASNRRQRGGSS